MSFTGTLDKCKACDKTVYVVDLLTLEGIPYHKNCFKCSHCKGYLTFSRNPTKVGELLRRSTHFSINYEPYSIVRLQNMMSTCSSMDGVLYCKPHFEQLFKESGNFSKNFQTKSSDKQNEHVNRTPNRLSSMFSGTLDKCSVCSKTVYPLEKMSLEGESYHKNCFRCAHAGCHLTHSSYAALDGVLYCKHHFQQLFMEKGNYNHVLQAAANRRNATPPPEPAELIDEPPKPEETKEETEEEEEKTETEET